MTRLRTLIVDDEPLAREGLRLSLSAEPDLELLPDAANGREALAQIATLQPDLLFLDMQMPGLSGLDVARALPAPAPLLIFLTAHSEYAAEAFRVAAVDYLLKPVTPALLQISLQRARLAHAQRAKPDHALPARLPFRADGSVHLLSPADITHIEAAGDYMLVHAGARRLLVRDTLAALQQQLAAHGFVRAHRSSLVNVAHIAELNLRDADDLQLVLRDGTTLKLSRNHRDTIEHALRLR